MVNALIQQESGGNPNAVSPAGAVGLTQFMPKTAAGRGVNPRDPISSINGTVGYLSDLHHQTGDWNTALAAYNWGPGNVQKYGTGNMPAETRKYVDTIMAKAPAQPPINDGAALLKMLGGGSSAAPEQPAQSAPINDGAALLKMLGGAPAAKPAPAAPAAPDERPSWLKALQNSDIYKKQVNSPEFKKYQQSAGYRGAAQLGSMVRGGLTGALGSVGNIENFVTQDVPSWFGQKKTTNNGVLGATTIAPQSSDVSQALTEMGWAPDKQHQTAEGVGNFIGGSYIPGERLGAATESVVKGGIKGANRIVERSYKPLERTTANLAGKVAQNSARVAPSEAAALVPRLEKSASLDGLPGVVRNQPAGKQAVDEAFQAGAMKHEATLHTAKQAAQAELEKQTAAMPFPPKPDMAPVQSLLKGMAANAGPKAEMTATNRVLADINRVVKDNPDPFNALTKIKRDVARKAGFGQTVTGYEGIDAANAKKIYGAINEALTTAHPAYGAFLKKYGELSTESAPFDSRFLKSLGEPESGGASMVDAAMKSPQNVKLAIKALGGSTKDFDALASQRVVDKLAGKSSADIERYLVQNSKTLAELPSTRRTVTSMLQRSDIHEATQGIEARAVAQGQSAASARELARGYTVDLKSLQAKEPMQRVAAMHSLVNKMEKAGSLDAAGADALRAQIEAASKSADKAKAWRAVSKYLVYALSGKYLLSFGGPAAFEVLAK